MNFDRALMTAFACSVMWGLQFCAASAAPNIVGPARVIDGDSLKVAGVYIRLNGIDAPEWHQTCRRNGIVYYCGEQAWRHLGKLIGSRPVRCVPVTRDRYRRIVATCYVGKVDLSAAMVRSGWALAFRRYSRRYIRQEIHARRNRAGMWAGQFIPPWEWRRRNR
jgi:endonuclease YncB( thermonuclease family)